MIWDWILGALVWLLERFGWRRYSTEGIYIG